MNSKTTQNALFLTVSVVFVSFLLSFTIQDDKWTAPSEADKLGNPFSNDEKAIKMGQKIFKKLCWSCHGLSGAGDGPAGVNLVPSPGNFTTDDFQSQTDGAIFWKLSNGRGIMAGYEATMEEEDRWKLVSYMRTFKK